MCHQTIQQLHAGGDYWQVLFLDKTQDTIKHTHRQYDCIKFNLTLAITLGRVDIFKPGARRPQAGARKFFWNHFQLRNFLQ